MDKTLQKINLTYCNLLIVKDLWQAHYQILSIIFLKELIAHNVNADTMIKNVKHVELYVSIQNAFLNTKVLKYSLIEYKCLCCNENHHHMFHELYIQSYTYKLYIQIF